MGTVARDMAKRGAPRDPRCNEIQSVTFWPCGDEPARPPEKSGYTKAILVRLAVTRNMTMEIVYGDDSTMQTVVGYISRGQCRDVWGDQYIAVKLQELKWHDGSNQREFESTNELARLLPENASKVLWVGRAKYVRGPGRETMLSCLIAERHSEDLLLRMQHTARNRALARGERLHRILNMLLVYTDIFVRAWLQNFFLDTDCGRCA